ncbi:Sec-independent protein translocase protein TatB [Methyloversatilis thermotolerans]|uniref:Sec-independent protein translocase protein TatB n=1 Tax=Methyloversatilis thermotolerans TaxID=1346290 RepID=UPI000378E751|nr:Sec-independent protein translocase protein TatB [Methyloversatilis thermotolerans]
MFDIGFSEFFVIGIVALLVLGPERLPRVARTAGHLLGRLQRYVNDVKSDISREMQLDELRKLQAQVEQQVREVERQAQDAGESVSKEVEGLSDQMKAALAEQEKYAAIEKAGVDSTGADVPSEPMAPVADADAQPTPTPTAPAAQLSLDIPPADPLPLPTSEKTVDKA